jgi:hypothetical protein
MSLEVVLHVVLGNEKMESGDEVLDAIRGAFTRQRDYATMSAPLVAGDFGVIIDGNGNTVGRWIVEAR